MASAGLELGMPFIGILQYQVAMWTLSGIATLFLVSRLAIRLSAKGRLMANDYFLIVALPSLYAASSLMQSILSSLYWGEGVHGAFNASAASPSVAARLTGAIEMLWITIYSVKFCFLAQFKFHKAPYAYVSVHLTRYYWASVGACGIGFLFTLAQPIIVCPRPGRCRDARSLETICLEMAVTVVDIVTSLFVISIPLLLVRMANFTRSHTIINASFKGLSVFSCAIAVTRLGLQYDKRTHGIRYVALTFLLVVEAAVALVMASISSYRIVLLHYLGERKIKSNPELKSYPFGFSAGSHEEGNYTASAIGQSKHAPCDLVNLGPHAAASTTLST